MTSAEEQQKSNMNWAMNNEYISGSALQIRLDTQPLLEKIEIYLKGQQITMIRDETGEIIPKVIEIGKPMANQEGIQYVLGFLNNICNTQTVQGNFKSEDEFGDYMCSIRKDFAEVLMNNLYEWQINIKHFRAITTTVMGMLYPFMSRLIGNKERESYAQTIKSHETATHMQSGGFNIPFLRRGGGQQR